MARKTTRHPFLSAANAIAPKPKLSLSEWADRYRHLSPESSAEHGKWRTNRTPYLKGILDAISDNSVRRVIIRSSSQVGKTEVCLNALGYFIHWRPSPILLVMPSLAMVESFSKTRLSTMLRDSPCFKDLLRRNKSETGNTLLEKNFANGAGLVMVGSASASSLSSRPIRVAVVDELSRCSIDVGGEGSALRLAEKRLATFWDSKLIAVSTPTDPDCQIEKEWELSTQHHYQMPCPHCGEYIELVWDNLQYDRKGQIDLTVETPSALKDLFYFCPECGAAIAETDRPKMMRHGIWVPDRPNASTVGFTLNELLSPWRRWTDVCLDYETARTDPLQMQVWQNCSLGLPYERLDGDRFDWERLLERAESSDYATGQIPEGALMLTAGVDVQQDRLECSLLGWGRDERAFLIGHYQLIGDPLHDEVWQALEDLTSQQFPHPLGGNLTVSRVVVDSGYLSGDCYVQIKRRRNWIAAKGVGGDRPIVSPPTVQGVDARGKRLPKHRGVKLYGLGTHKLKLTALTRSKLLPPAPKSLSLPRDVTKDWCEQFAGSELLVKRHRNGRATYQFELTGDARNEALDCYCYALAGALLLGIDRVVNWDKLEEIAKSPNGKVRKFKEPDPEPTPPEPEPTLLEKPVMRRSPRRHRNGFLSNIGGWN